MVKCKEKSETERFYYILKYIAAYQAKRPLTIDSIEEGKLEEKNVKKK